MKIERLITIPNYSLRNGERIESEEKQTILSDSVAFERDRQQKKEQKFFTQNEENTQEKESDAEQQVSPAPAQALQAHGKGLDILA